MAINKKFTTLITKYNNLIYLTSPLVGKVISLKCDRKYLQPNAEIANIKILNSTFTIISPKKLEGWIKTINFSLGMPLNYGQTLLTLKKEDLQINIKDSNTIKSEQKFISESYLAPMDGLFYRRASPKESFFINEGDIINPGDTIGLIEVMKCFYELKYEDINPKRVNKILFTDASSVNAGDKLFELCKI